MRYFFALFALVFVACGGVREHAGFAAMQRPHVLSAVEAPASTPSDAQLADAVARELAADPAASGAIVRVAASEGVVELHGRVPDRRAADAAVARAETVHGVVAVRDRTRVPTVRDRRALERDVRAALAIDPVTGSMPLTLGVVDGVVTIDGRAPGLGHRQLAEETVRSVRGVRAVVDRIQLAREPRADSSVLADVRAALRADRRVDDWLVEAHVQNGVVHLRGAQPTAAARRRAIELAWDNGARSVTSNELRVRPDLSSELRSPPAGYVYPDDREIAAAIDARWARHPRLAGTEHDVAVREGVVTLRGDVDTLAARRTAEEIAQSVRGVFRVANELRIVAETPSDAELEDRVQRALVSVALRRVDVEARGGAVRIHGRVRSQHAKIMAQDAIERVPGVRGIDNRLRAPALLRPSDDLALMQDVVERLERNPNVDGERIRVLVDDGTVMLRGRVYDRREAAEAVRSAWTAGPREVLDGIAR